MKTIQTVVAIIFIYFSSYNTATSAVIKNVSKGKTLYDTHRLFVTVNKKGDRISLYDLSNISRADLEKLTGRKMNMIERLYFKKAQRQISESMDDQGQIADKSLAKKIARSWNEDGSGFNIGGFALGFVLGPLGILVSYVAFNNDDDDVRRSRIKWSWIGFGAAIAIAGLLVSIAMAKVV